MVRRTQHNVASATKHLPGACGGHDVRKASRRVRASGMSGIEHFVRRDVSPRRATSRFQTFVPCARQSARQPSRASPTLPKTHWSQPPKLSAIPYVTAQSLGTMWHGVGSADIRYSRTVQHLTDGNAPVSSVLLANHIRTTHLQGSTAPQPSLQAPGRSPQGAVAPQSP